MNPSVGINSAFQKLSGGLSGVVNKLTPYADDVVKLFLFFIFFRFMIKWMVSKTRVRYH